jgi:hypothetical protein
MLDGHVPGPPFDASARSLAVFVTVAVLVALALPHFGESGHVTAPQGPEGRADAVVIVFAGNGACKGAHVENDVEDLSRTGSGGVDGHLAAPEIVEEGTADASRVGVTGLFVSGGDGVYERTGEKGDIGIDGKGGTKGVGVEKRILGKMLQEGRSDMRRHSGQLVAGSEHETEKGSENDRVGRSLARLERV